MYTINISEVTGTGIVTGPNITNIFSGSGIHSGDSISVSVTGITTTINVDVVDSGQAVSITGIASSGDNINVLIQEAVYSGTRLPSSIRLYYSGDGKLIQKVSNGIDTDFTYNADDTLNQVILPTYTKTMLYDSNSILTGFDVTF